MVVDRRTVTIGDVCEVFDGPHATPTRTDVGPVFLGISSLDRGRIDISKSDRISEEQFAVWTKRILPQSGDVVFSYETRLGEAGIIPDGLVCCLGRRMGLMRVKDTNTLDPKYLLYAYLGPAFQQTIAERTYHGSTVDRIPLIEFPQFPIELPSIEEQRQVARILSALDDKIELNQKTNETLEALAKALFKSWFVDFEPTLANLEQSATISANPIYSLFPRETETSELGEIPKGWSIASVDEWISLQRGTTYKSELIGLDGPILLGLASIARDGGFRGDSLRTYGGESPSRLILVPGDLYVSLKDVTQSGDLLGSVARVPLHVERGRLTQDTVHLVPKSQFDTQFHSDFLYLLLRTERYREYCRARAMGTTNLSLSREDFLSFKFPCPPPGVLTYLMEIISPIISRMEDVRETIVLAQIRDTLLPKLISGELRVPDAEPVLEAAGV